MKKLLALVLALVMTLGLATVGASAASYKVKYDDANTIDYKEAADVLSAVGVFNGKGSNFAPKDNLNRAEAAKLVAYLMLGNKTAESIKGNGNKFADVPADHFAAGYIEYLATAGVVSGVGGGNFNPNGPVTAVQFAKMLCVALGYDAQVEGYVGESWNINIMKQANDDELFKILEVGSNDVLTREQAAQMCLNALKADTVEYESKGDTLTINNSTVVLNAKKAKDKTSSASKAYKIKDDELLTNGDSVLQLGEDLYNGDLELRKVGDDFNRPANKWIYKLEDIGTYVNKSDLKAEYRDEIKRGPLYDLVGKSVYDNLVDGNAALFYYEDGVGGAVNTQGTKAERTAAVEKFIQKNGDKAINDGKSSGRGSLTQVFVDKDDETTITVVNSYVYKAASDYRASTEDVVISVPTDAKNQGNANTSIASGYVNLDTTRLELADFSMIKDIKKDDYLILTAYNNGGATYTPKEAVKGELLTGKVEKVVVGDSVTIDGTTYKYEKTATTDIKNNEFSVGQETTVVLDPYGYIVYVDEAVVADNYVFISELFQTGGNTSKVQANAYFTDGTNSDITIKEIAGISNKTTLLSAKDGTTNNPGDTGVVDDDQYYVGWYTYSKNSANEYTLNALGSGYSTRVEDRTGNLADNEELIKSDTVKFVTNANVTEADDDRYNAAVAKGSTSDPAQANDKTIMIVTYKDKTDVDVYTGVKNIPDITLVNDATNGDGQAIIFSAIKNGYAKYVFVSLEGSYMSFGSESEHLLYIVKYDNMHKISDNKNYYTYKALDENGKDILIEAENILDKHDSSDANKLVYQAYYKASKNADGRYTRVQAIPSPSLNSKYFAASTDTATDPITAENGTLNIANESFTLANDYKLIVVSRSDLLNKWKTSDQEYEANPITAESLESMVSSYDVSYSVQAKLSDDYKGNGGKIVEAYVTLGTDAVATSGTGRTSSTDSGILAVVLPDDIKATESFQVYYAGSKKPTSTDVEIALDAALLDRGFDITKVNANDYDLKNLVTGSTVSSALNTEGQGQTKVQRAESLSGTAKTGTTTFNGILVVENGKTLTIPKGATVVADAVVADGNIVIENGGKLTITNNTKLSYGNVANTYGLIITRDGDVTVKTGGSISAVGTVGKVSEGSTSLISSGNIDMKQLDIAGHADFSGGIVTAAVVSQDGADIGINGTAVMNGEILVTGGAVEIAGTAVVDTVTNNAATSAVKVTSKTATVTNVAGSYGVTGEDGEKVASGSIGVKYVLNIATANALGITGVTNATKAAAGIYYVAADTKTIEITVTNWTKAEANVSDGNTQSGESDVTVDPDDAIGKIAAGDSKKITVTVKNGVKTNFAVGIGTSPVTSYTVPTSSADETKAQTQTPAEPVEDGEGN